MPVHILESLPLFADEFRRFKGREEVIVVAPDTGASKLVTHFGRLLGLNVAIASKHRPCAEEASITEVIGEFRGKSTAIVLDDMINTGGTAHALIKKLVTEKGIEEVHLAVSHNLCMEKAGERLVELHQRYRLKQLIVTDSIPQNNEFTALPFILIRSLSDTFAHVINSVHFNLPVNEYRDLFTGETAERG